MEVKPGYKQTEVGIIPDDWNVVAFESITTTIGDGLHGTPVYSSNGYCPFINGNNLNDGKIVVTSDTKMVDHSEMIKHRKPLSDKSILMSINGTIGKLGLYAGEQIVLGKSAAYLNVKADTSRQFVYHSLQTQIVKRQFLDGLTGSTIGNLGLATIRQTQIPLPPNRVEQRAIATALSDVDALLGGLDRLIAKKRDLKQAAMQQLLTGQTRLPGFSGAWVKTKISETCEYVDGVRTTGGDVGYVEIGDIDVERKSYSLSQKEKLSVPGAVKVPAGTLLISTVRPTRGAIAVTQSALYVSSAFCRLRPANAILFHLVCQPTFLAHLGENSIGGTYPTCRDETILDYETALPGDPREQTAIAAVLSDMDAELAALEARRDKTRDLKQAMMQELLTGKTRLVKPEAAHA